MSKRKSRAQHQELAGMFQEKAKSIAARVCWRYKSVASRAFSQFQGQAKRLASRVRMFQEKVNSSAMLSIKSALGLIAWPQESVKRVAPRTCWKFKEKTKFVARTACWFVQRSS